MKVIVVEGSDGVGKSTVCTRLNEILGNSAMLHQPNDIGPFGEIIRYIKKKQDMQEFERQLVFLASHMYDMSWVQSRSTLDLDYFIQDRCPLSALIYSNDKITDREKVYLIDILKDTYGSFYKSHESYFFLIDRDNRINSVDTDCIYENSVGHFSRSSVYKKFYNYEFGEFFKPFFKESRLITAGFAHADMDSDAVVSQILNIIGYRK